MSRLLLCLLLVGCTNTTDPILRDRMCIKSHTTTAFIPMTTTSCAKTCTTTTRIQPVITVHCDTEIFIEYPNPDYKAAARGGEGEQ